MKPTALDLALEDLQCTLEECTEASTLESRARAAVDRAIERLAVAVARHARARDRVVSAQHLVELEEKEAGK